MGTKHGRIFLRILVAVVVMIPLCGCDPVFNPLGPRANRDAISLPLVWRISSQGGTFKNLRGAIDGLAITKAETVGNYRGTSITVDLKRPCIFNTVVLVHGDKPFGFARTISLATSRDGKNFTQQITTQGTRKFTYINLLTSTTARYIRITVVKPGTEPWAISQIYFQ
ncbi:MAG: discoidin domain-containing protein [Phycisphaerae bacterium]|nr:discoidin domain-containing protein [Phycisphaerae bacterium]